MKFVVTIFSIQFIVSNHALSFSAPSEMKYNDRILKERIQFPVLISAHLESTNISEIGKQGSNLNPGVDLSGGNRYKRDLSSRGNINCNESEKCKATDLYGVEWTGCPSEHVIKNCSIFSWAYDGHANWDCTRNGNQSQFVGAQPNIYCYNRELSRIELPEALEASEATEQGNHILNQLNDLLANNSYLGGDILDIMYKVQYVVDNIHNSDVSLKDRENITAGAICIIVNLITLKTPWSQLHHPTQKYDYITELLSEVEATVFKFVNGGRKEILGNKSSLHYTKTFNPFCKKGQYVKEDFVVTVGAMKNSNESIKFPMNTQSSFILVPKELVIAQQEIDYVGMSMNPEILKELMPSSVNKLREGHTISPSSSLLFNGKVLSLTFSNKTVEKLVSEFGVEVKFGHAAAAIFQEKIEFPRRLHSSENRKAILGVVKCAYWSTTEHEWKGNGCEKLDRRSNSYETVCKCTHLNAFSLLTDLHDYAGKERWLEVLTLLLSPLSIFLLISTFGVHTRMNILQGERASNIKHLCVNLIFSNIILLLFVDRNYFSISQTSCMFVAMFTHYAFMASFGWMAVEALYLYRTVVLQSDWRKDYKSTYIVGVYCFPIILIGLTSAIGYEIGDQPYGGELFCWLNGNYVWAFMAPAALIFCGNSFILEKILTTIYHQKISKIGLNNRASNGNWIKGCTTITFVLGLTWIAGFFTFTDTQSTIFMPYVFTVLNASQGIFIFVFFCALHKKVYPLIVEKLNMVSNIVFDKSKDGSVGKRECGKPTETAAHLSDSQSEPINMDGVSII